MGKTRIHDLAAEFGVESAGVIKMLADMGIHVRSHLSALDPDQDILDGMARAARPQAPVVFTAFNAYLQVGNLLDGNDFDAVRGVHRETTEIRDPDGVAVTTDLWTTCFTPRELRLMCARAGLEVRSIESVEPGDWVPRPPDHHSPEFLVVAAASL